MDVSETVATYLEHARHELSPGALYVRQRMLAKFERHVGKSLLECGPADVARFLTRVLPTGATPTQLTTLSERSNLSRFYTWAIDQQLVGQNPVAALPVVSVPRNPPRSALLHAPRSPAPWSPSDDALIERHLAEMTWRGLARGTIYQRRRTLYRLSTVFGSAILDITPDQIMGFLDRRKSDGSALAAKSRAVERTHLAAFYEWAVFHGHLERNPAARLPRIKVRRALPHPIDEDDLAQALAGAPERIRPWLYLAAYAGLRAKEIAALHADDICWDTDPPVIVVREGKGGDEGVVPMSPVLQTALAGLPTTGYLFPHSRSGKRPVSPWTVSSLASQYLHSIGIDNTLHSLRHRFGTQVYRASGRDLRQTQELLRHRSIQSTTVYTAVDQREGAAVVAKLPAPLVAIDGGKASGGKAS